MNAGPWNPWWTLQRSTENKVLGKLFCTLNNIWSWWIRIFLLGSYQIHVLPLLKNIGSSFACIIMRSAKMKKNMLNLCGKCGKYGNYAEIMRSFFRIKKNSWTYTKSSQIWQKMNGMNDERVWKIESTAVFLVSMWRSGQGVIDQPVIALYMGLIHSSQAWQGEITQTYLNQKCSISIC